MNKLKDLEYENLVELLDYLEGISGSEIEEEKKTFAEEKIHNFFPKLSALQEIEFANIVNTRDPIAFEAFKREYPDMDIDTEGKSKPDQKNYWEIKEKAIKSIYEIAEHSLKNSSFRDESPNKINSQVYNARSLSCLLNRKFQEPKMYTFSKKMFVDKFPGEDYINYKRFESIENILKSFDIDYTVFLSYVIEYCISKNRDNFIYFLENLFARIEVLGSDKDLKSEESTVILENVKSVVNKNN